MCVCVCVNVCICLFQANSEERRLFREEFKECEPVRKLAELRRARAIRHEDAVAAGERVANQEADKEDETHIGVCLFVLLLPYFRLGYHAIHDDMHELVNTMKDIIALIMRTGSQKFSGKRRAMEQDNGRFVSCGQKGRPFFLYRRHSPGPRG